MGPLNAAQINHYGARNLSVMSQPLQITAVCTKTVNVTFHKKASVCNNIPYGSKNHVLDTIIAQLTYKKHQNIIG